MADVVLRFIAGKQQGREFPVKNEQEIVIGRDEDANLRIDEDTVSRKHAVLILKNDEIVLQDFSKNGTYVNGHAIFFVTLKDGDQIHIGRSIFKVVINTPPPTPTWIIGAPRPERTVPAVPASGSYLSSLSKVATVVPSALSAAKPAPRPAPVGTSTSDHFRGSISEIALTDLLQLFATTRKNGTLLLRSRDMIGRIYFVNGQVIHTSMDDEETVNALKILYRLLRWTDGTFELEPPDGKVICQTIDESTDYLLLEAMHQLDEINNLGPELPTLHAEIVIANPLPAPLRDLAPGDLDFIQLALRHKMVRCILDHYAGTDFEGYIHLKGLLARRYLTVAES